MANTLMSWYERELSFLYTEARSFAEEHPQLASHLGVSYDSVSDPHVARLLEAFALINARLSRQLAEGSTQLSSSLLNIVFPMCLQSLPSTSMIQIAPSKEQSQVATLPSGTRFRAYVNEDQFCRFRTTRDMQLCPFDIVDHQFESRPFVLSDIDYPESSTALLKMELAMLDESRSFSDLSPFSEIIIHFQGLARHQARIYDYLLRHRCHMVLANGSEQQVTLSTEQFAAVGFTGRDSMITHDNSTFLDYQMMLELFAWPELFFGFRLLDIGNALRQFACQRVTLLLFLEDTVDEQVAALSSIRYSLGCAPVINLFEHIAEPVVVDHRQLSYQLVPDTHSANTLEVQSVQKVLDITGEQPELLPPLYGLKHNDTEHNRFWLYHPPEADSDACGQLSVVYPELQMNKNQTMVLSPHLICNNGMQVLELPDNPRLECLDSIALPVAAKMIMRPTARIRRKQSIKNRLNLLVHLKGAFTSVLQGRDPASDLRTLMYVYCLHNNSVSTAWLDSLVQMQPRPLVAPLRISGHQCFTQGIELIIELDPSRLKQVSIMMFVNLIDFMAAGYAGYHNFIEVVIRLKGDSGDYMRCTRRHGYQINR